MNPRLFVPSSLKSMSLVFTCASYTTLHTWISHESGGFGSGFVVCTMISTLLSRRRALRDMADIQTFSALRRGDHFIADRATHVLMVMFVEDVLMACSFYFVNPVYPSKWTQS